MPRIVKNVTRQRKGGRKPKYNWSKWFDGRLWEIVRYVDFTCTPHSLENLIRRTAAARGLTVRVFNRTAKVGDDRYPSLVVQAIRPESDAA